jgi:hypothetical protein
VKADFSRLNFDELQHYVGVVHQQGRVWLDSDWNDDVFERLRLLEQETLDIVGGCGVPKPHTAFQISALPDGSADDFAIRGGAGPAGHYYVDGILAQLEHDATYRTQPDLPDAPSVDLGDGRGAVEGIVYLEVWQRLISHVEDPGLQEIALGGPDTAGRLRTIAQVKVRQVAGRKRPLTCDDAERLLPRPGSGTLTTVQPTDAPPDADCEIPDPGSYTGRENHLYRIEVHDAGDVLGSAGGAFRAPLAADVAAGTMQLTLGRALTAPEEAALPGGVVSLVDDRGQHESLPVVAASGSSVTVGRGLDGSFRVADQARIVGGAATFKWSRDNAGFAVQITAVADDRVTLSLASLGRDVITTLRDGDVVEVADDTADLGPGRGHLTVLVADPEADPPRVTLGEPLPARLALPGTPPDRHLKLRKWDGLGVAQAAFDPLGTPDMNLGDGVRIHFGGTDLRPGDYWTFTARRADGSVQRLDASPPHGIVRHRCVLAIVRWRPDTRYRLRDVLEAARAADLGDVFNKLVEAASKLEEAGVELIDIEAIRRALQEAGADAAEVQRVLDELEKFEGERRPRFEVAEDCRRPFDPLTELTCGCDCTATVEPGESIAEAIRRVPDSGGTVCLLPGVHELRSPVEVANRHGLVIRGTGTATEVRAIDLPVAFRFENCDQIVVRDLALIGGRIVRERAPLPPRFPETVGERLPTELAPRAALSLDPAALREAAEIRELLEARGTEAGEAPATAASAPREDPFPGLLTFVDCHGTVVEGCSLLYAAPSRAGRGLGLGVASVDSTFLTASLASGIRTAMMGRASEPEPAQPAEGASAVGGTAPQPAPPEERPSSGDEASPERMVPLRELEATIAGGISALRAAMSEPSPSISEAAARRGSPARATESEARAAERPASDEVLDHGLLDRLMRRPIRSESPAVHLDRGESEPARGESERFVREAPVSETRGSVLIGTVEETSSPEVPVSENPVRVHTMTVDAAAERQLQRQPIDLTVRGCRLFVGRGRGGVFVAGGIGVTIADNILAPLPASISWGFDPTLARDDGPAGVGYGVVLANDALINLRDNVIADFGFGVVLVEMPTRQATVRSADAGSQIVGNTVTSKRGLALWAVSRQTDLVLAHNALSGEATEGQGAVGLTAPEGHAATADITADNVVIVGNRFGCTASSDVAPTHAVGVQASDIVFVGNQSTCDRVPSRANVVLRAGGRDAPAGRISAVSNLCREPRAIRRGDLRFRIEDAINRSSLDEPTTTRLRRITTDFASDDDFVARLRRPIEGVALSPEILEALDAAERDPAPPQSVEELQTEVARIDADRSRVLAEYMASRITAAEVDREFQALTGRQLLLEERIRDLTVRGPILYSLAAQARVTVTGMNILSHGLLRSGIGSDTGTVQNVP